MSLSQPTLRSITSYLGHDSSKLIYLSKQIVNQIDLFILTNTFGTTDSYDAAIKSGNLRWIKHLVYYGYAPHWMAIKDLLVKDSHLEILKWFYYNQKEIWEDLMDIDGFGLTYHDLNITKWSRTIDEPIFGIYYDPCNIRDIEYEGVKWYVNEKKHPSGTMYLMDVNYESKITQIKYAIYLKTIDLGSDIDRITFDIERSQMCAVLSDIKFLYYRIDPNLRTDLPIWYRFYLPSYSVYGLLKWTKYIMNKGGGLTKLLLLICENNPEKNFMDAFKLNLMLKKDQVLLLYRNQSRTNRFSQSDRKYLEYHLQRATSQKPNLISQFLDWLMIGS